jgi:hypothetical protein
VRRRKARSPATANAVREARGWFKAGELLNDPDATSTDLTCLSAYDGTDLAGFIVERTGRFIAYDLHDHLIGTFPTLRPAVRAIPRVRP